MSDSEKASIEDAVNESNVVLDKTQVSDQEKPAPSEISIKEEPSECIEPIQENINGDESLSNQQTNLQDSGEEVIAVEATEDEVDLPGNDLLEEDGSQSCVNQEQEVASGKNEQNVVDLAHNEPDEDADVTAGDDEMEPISDSHPYLYLVESFQFTSEQTTIAEIGPPKDLTDTPLIVVHNKTHLLKVLQKLKNAKEIAVDINYDKKVFKDNAVLITLSTREADYIIDSMLLKKDVLLLTEIFINPKIVKIVHNIDYILSSLQHKFHLFLVNIFGIEKTAKAVHGGAPMGMNVIVKRLFPNDNLRDPALIRNGGSFRQRPLTTELKTFVRYVAHYSIYVYHYYKNDLLKNNEKLYKDLLNQFRDTCKTLYEDQGSLQLQGMESDLRKRHNCQMDCLKQLYDWRNTVAKNANKTPEMIISKNALMNLVVKLPTVDAEILSIANSGHVKTEVKNIIALINKCKKTHKFYDRKAKKKNKKPKWVTEKQEESSNTSNPKRKLNDSVESGPVKQKRTEYVGKNKTPNQTEKSPNKKKKFPKSKLRLPEISTLSLNRPNPFLQPKINPFNANVLGQMRQLNNDNSYFNRNNNYRNDDYSQSLSFFSQNNSTFEPPATSLNVQAFDIAGLGLNSNQSGQDSFNTSGGSGLSVQSFNMSDSGLNRNAFKMPESCFNRDLFNTSGYGQGTETDDDVLKRCLLAMKNSSGNRPRNFDNALNAIDHKIDMLERKVSGFQKQNQPNDRGSYKRRL